MYSDPGQGRPRDRIRSDSGLTRENTVPAPTSTSGTTRSPSSRDTLSSIDQFSPQRAAYSEGEWNDDTDSGNAENGQVADWELRSTVAKLKKMSLRTFRLWR